jgi:drug/metabolite transporter (DMT)-like permease
MNWYFYLSFSIILISFNGLFHRSLLKDSDSSPQAQTVVFLGLGGLLAALIALSQNKLDLYFPEPILWNLALIVLLLTPAYVLKYKAYQLIGASEVVMFSVTGRLWNVVGGYLFLHELLTPKIVFGAILILCGVMLSRYEKKKFVFNKGVLIVLLASLLFGFGDINNFQVLKFMDSSTFLVYSYFLPVVSIIAIQPQTIKKIRYYFQLNRAIKVILLSLGDTIGMLMLFLSFQAGGPASVIGPLRATSIIITTLLAIVILKERGNILNKVVGSIIAATGAVLLL